MVFSFIHAVASVHFRADHIISGTVLNLAAPGLAVFLVRAMYGAAQKDHWLDHLAQQIFSYLVTYQLLVLYFLKTCLFRLILG